ncbi:MAG TPA: GntR family transcriptional regulator [Protaetiibacter sp.]|nr:GntR family transcriptional regulator [Protaetiibacter sp.]
MTEPVDPLAGIELDTSSLVPVYYQLYEALRAQLGTDPYAPGSRFSTERSIAERVGVSRQTVRQALARLEREGLVHRRQGDGTYVSEPRLEGSLRILSGFTSELGLRGLRVRNRVLDLKLVTPPTAVAESLGLGTARDSAVMLRRVRILDGAPATLETVWLPADRCAPLLGVAMENRSLYTTLREQLGIEPHRAVERLGATVLDEFEASELDRRPGDPALLVERTTYDSDDRPIEAVKSLLRADRFSFSTELDLDTTGVTADSDVE